MLDEKTSKLESCQPDTFKILTTEVALHAGHKEITWMYSSRIIKHSYAICLPSVTNPEKWLQRTPLPLLKLSSTCARAAGAILLTH